MLVGEGLSDKAIFEEKFAKTDLMDLVSSAGVEVFQWHMGRGGRT